VKNNFCTASFDVLANNFDWTSRDAFGKLLSIKLAIVDNFGPLNNLTKRLQQNTDAVKTTRNLITTTTEFTAGVKNC